MVSRLWITFTFEIRTEQMLSNDELLKLLEDYMASHNLRKHELARKLHTTPVSISRWLNRKHKIGRAWAQLIEQRLAE